MVKEVEFGIACVVAIVLAMPFVGFCKADNTYEENDNRSSATEVTVGTYENLNCSDDDWYKVNLTAGENIRVDIYFSHAEGNLELERRSPDNTTLAYSYSSTNNESVSVANVEEGGFYYIGAHGAYHYEGAYEL